MSKLHVWAQGLEPELKQKYIKYSVISLAVVVVLGWYFISGEGDKRKEEQLIIEEGMKQEEVLDNFDLMADDVSETFANQFEKQNLTIDEAMSASTRAEQKTDAMSKQMNVMLDLLRQEKNSIETSQDPKNTAYYELPEAQSQGYQPPPRFNDDQNLDITQTAKIIGTIGRVQGLRQAAEKKTQKTEKYFLPISFAKAQTLHGLRIVTSDGAMADPEQLLIRIQAPNILPNSIRSDLEGCFVMSSVTGHLAKRRVDPQLAYISCLNKDGQSVIEEEVQGYVVDADGNKGMSANIVSQMSDFIWRALLTGTVGGIGEGVSLSGVSNAITGGGQVQTFDPNRITQSALGKGLKSGSDAIQEIFIDLAKQHAPVAEVGSSKQVYVVFQKGVWLNIKPRYAVDELTVKH
jgi:conjugal transfer pilus assembly protein TraB